MNEVGLDSFEKLIRSDIKNIRPKSKQRGYARELVEKLYSTIESALEKGCSYEEIADAMSKKIKISPVTLKQYHQANKNSFQSKNAQAKNISNKQRTEGKKNTVSDSEKSNNKLRRENSSHRSNSNKLQIPSQLQKLSEPKTDDNRSPIPPILSGASLTDDDYLEDFNDY